MAKPETTFTHSVHRFLPPVSELWREKMSNPYRSGGADYWYSGHRDLWVEWKFIVVPVRDTTMIKLVNPDVKDPPISVLQQAWLRDRSIEGRNVVVIVGCKAGGVIFPTRSWEKPLTAAAFRAALCRRQEIAQEIINLTE